jgi:hypothetical protein
MSGKTTGFASELSLAELYDTTSMLPELVKAHQLDKTVEAAYCRSFDDTASGWRICLSSIKS